MTRRSNSTRYVFCVKNRGYEASLEVRKVYRLAGATRPPARGLLAVVDESGEDYLYPARFFVPIDLPRRASRVFVKVPS